MTLILSKKKKKWRMRSSTGLNDCNACLRDDHEFCEEQSMIFCRCWREKHEEMF